MVKMTSGVIPISLGQLAFAAVFVIAAFCVMVGMKLGLAREYLWAAIRGSLQVLALGYVLSWLFHLESGLVVLSVLLFMSGVASLTIAKRVKSIPGTIVPSAFVVLFFICLLITFTVTGLIVQVRPWYLPQYVIPVAGMVLGNGMTGIAIALNALYRDMESREDEIRGLVALGATPYEAAQPSIRAALRAGLIPNINTLAAVGIVFIPGMMSGQILAGTAPSKAAPYQIVILFMVSAADAIGSMLATLILYKRHFAPNGAFVKLNLPQKKSWIQMLTVRIKNRGNES